jgi:hypothetical protein
MTLWATGGSLRAMSSYAVLWQTGGDKPASGRLEFDPYGLWLQGGKRGAELRIEIPYEEITAAARDPQAHIGPCRAIRIESRSAEPLLLASIGGIGVLGEILATLRDATSG